MTQVCYRDMSLVFFQILITDHSVGGVEGR